MIIKKYQIHFNELENRKATKNIVIHHTGNPTNDDESALQIHFQHLNQGWSGIGYHYVIRKNGTVEQGRPHWTVGAHAYGHNSNTIGIHLSGNFEIGEPTSAQLGSLAYLVAVICRDYGLTPSDVLGHKQLNATACPGRNLYAKLGSVRERAREIIAERGKDLPHLNDI